MTPENENFIRIYDEQVAILRKKFMVSNFADLRRYLVEALEKAEQVERENQEWGVAL